MSEVRQTVLVTGASGFLGQHVVKLLQERDSKVGEIRCLDIKPYYNNLEHGTTKPMKLILGDIRNPQTCLDATRGVQCIIHCAGLCDTRVFANKKDLEDVNVKGTQNLIEAAVENNVPYFIHVSTIEVVCGSDPIYYGAENTTVTPKHPCFGPYAKSKLAAESVIKKANEQTFPNGNGRLFTVILRPTIMYGEGDENNITQFMRIAKNSEGYLPRIDNTFIRTQFCYVGNVAWAILKAKEKLEVDNSLGGEEIFITDDTQISDPFDFAKPFMESCGFHMSVRAYPYLLLMFLLNIMVFFVKIIHPFYPVPLSPMMNPGALRFLTTTYFFNRTKATLRLEYKPLYSPEESQTRSMEYYKSLNL